MVATARPASDGGANAAEGLIAAAAATTMTKAFIMTTEVEGGEKCHLSTWTGAGTSC